MTDLDRLLRQDTTAGPTAQASPPRHAMTVDVEDYFQVYAFFHCIPRDTWDGYARRVEANVDRILTQFAAANVSATFFTLGWIAERHPAMIRRIVEAGHELASHGYDHTRVDAMDAAAFRADLLRTRNILQDTGGVAVRGYRAPTFSIGPTTPWAFEIMAETGHTYSSSVNPVRSDNYGMPDAPRTPYQPLPGNAAFWEFPMTTVRLFGRNLPCAGGGYFRLLPVLVVPPWLHARDRNGAPRGHFLFPPVGGRSRSASGSGLRLEVAVAALHQPGAHVGAAGAPAGRFRLGSHGPGVRGRVGRHRCHRRRGNRRAPGSWPGRTTCG